MPFCDAAVLHYFQSGGNIVCGPLMNRNIYLHLHQIACITASGEDMRKGTVTLSSLRATF
jgi:hypothetical protein